MINQVVLVGKLTHTPMKSEFNDDKKATTITLEVGRSFKNNNGIYETDFIKCRLWNNVADSAFQHCKKGDYLGVKGRIESINYETENEVKENAIEVIAEKISFISNKKTKNIKP